MVVNLSEIIDIIERFNVDTVVIGDQRCVFMTRDEQYVRKVNTVWSRVAIRCFVKRITAPNATVKVTDR